MHARGARDVGSNPGQVKYFYMDKTLDWNVTFCHFLRYIFVKIYVKVHFKELVKQFTLRTTIFDVGFSKKNRIIQY